MPLAAGQTLSHYTILAPLGAGAMGEVWRAKDTQLGREVAIKVLPDHFASDEERLRRFEREAKTLATVNHPNVAQIHGVDRVSDTSFLVLELVPGESLADRLKRGPLPLEEAIDVCKQIAEGLEAAHEAGVIHRDLKPANIRITPEGKVKLLDFGLAKPVRAEGSTEDSTDSVLSTEQGRLLGTPTYMAPEQARGKSIDKRVDIWAFGCVLYECLTKKRAFAGATLADVLGAVMHTEPDWKALPSNTPPHIRELLARCLAKDPHQRQRDIGDARIALSSPNTSIQVRQRWQCGGVSLAGAALVALAGYAFFLTRKQADAPAQVVVRSTLALPQECEPDIYSGGCLALSPDGRFLLISAAGQRSDAPLWIRPLDSPNAQPLAGTAGATYPFWAPDGSQFGFFAEGKLKRTSPSGGSPTTIADAREGRGASWSRDGRIVFAPDKEGPLFSVPELGGVPVAITSAKAGASHRRPCFLPDGQHLVFASQEDDPSGILLLDLQSGKTTRIADESSEGVCVDAERLLFVRGGDLLLQGLDVAHSSLVGEPRLLAEDVLFNPIRRTGCYAISAAKTLVYREAAVPCQLEWLDFEGHSLGTLGTPGRFVQIKIAPDGRQIVAILDRPGGKRDLCLLDSKQGVTSTLARDVAVWMDEPEMAWSPDSRQIAYTTSRAKPTTWICPIDGSAESQSFAPGWVCDWSRDGAWICVHDQDPTKSLGTTSVLPADGGGVPRKRMEGLDGSGSWRFSPDGRWMVAVAHESGRMEVGVAPALGSAPIRILTSTGVDGDPAWLDDGRIVYARSGGQWMEMKVTSQGDELEIGTSQPILGERRIDSTRIAFSRDGKRILAAVPLDANAEHKLTLVQNWPTAIGLR